MKSRKTKSLPRPLYLESQVVAANFRHDFCSADGSRMIPALSRVPFDVAATELLRSAMRGNKPVPSVLGSKRAARTLSLAKTTTTL